MIDGRAFPIAAALLGLCLLARAAHTGEIAGTHHDIGMYVKSGYGECGFCHRPHRAEAPDYLFNRAAPDMGIGVVGNFCFTFCHDGMAFPGGVIESPAGEVGISVLLKSHGLRIASVSRSGIESAENLKRGELPFVGSQEASRLQCSSCHNVHSNRYPPFLQLPMDDLCMRCHSGSDFQGKGRYTMVTDGGPRNGAHPVGMPMTYSGHDKVRGPDVLERVFRGSMAAALQVPVLRPQELASPASHWRTGGHLADSPEDAGAGLLIGCNTCHSAHMPDPDLLVLPASDAENSSNPLCLGCHCLEENPANPGGTPYYHPVFSESLPPYEISIKYWGMDIRQHLSISIPSDWPVGKDRALLCTTCHVTHGGVEGQRMIRRNTLGKKRICDVCHLPEGPGMERNSHHATGVLDYTAPEAGGYKNPSWYWGPGEPGDLSDGLTCVDCHTELVKSAHNW